MDFNNYDNEYNYTTNEPTDTYNINENKKNNIIEYFKNNKKLTMIVLSIVVFVIVSMTIVVINNIKINSKILLDTFDISKPILIKEKGKYGYINTDGKTIIKPEYDYATNYNGNYAAVGNEDEEGYRLYKLLDINGKKVNEKDIYSKPTYVSQYGLWEIDGRLYDINLEELTDSNDIVTYQKDGYSTYINLSNKTAGVINSKGKKVYTYKFTNVNPFISLNVSTKNESSKYTYCSVNVSNYYAIINCDTGKVIYKYTKEYISNKDDNIFYISKYSSGEGITGDYLGRVYMYIDNDKILYQTPEDAKNVSLYYSKGYLTSNYKLDKKEVYKYVDLKTGEELDTKPESANSNFEDITKNLYGYIITTNNGKFGLNKGNKVIIESNCEKLSFASMPLYNYLSKKNNEDIVYCKMYDKYYVINAKNAKTIASFDNTSSLKDYDDSSFISISLYSGDVVAYNLITKQSMVISKNNQTYIYSNYIKVVSGNTVKYYNAKLKEVYKTYE